MLSRANGFLVILLSLCLIACTAMQPVPPTYSGIKNNVRPGDQVVIRTNDGVTHRFRVTQVTQSRVIGDNNDSISINRIQEIKRQTYAQSTRRLSSGAIAGIVIGSLLVVGVVIFAALFKTSEDAIGPALAQAAKNAI